MADTGSSRRVLIVAAAPIEGDEVRAAIAERVGDDAEVRLLAPAVDQSAFELVMGDVDEAMEQARETLARSTAELRRAGIDADGDVGDPDVKLAIEDALRTFPADEVVIVGHRDAPRIESRGIEDAEHEIEPKITEIFVSGDGGGAHVAATDEVGEGRHPVDPAETEPRSRNLPPFSPRDLAGIAVALIGTIILIVLAATCENPNQQGGFDDASGGGLDECAARMIIAGALALANIAHVVGLMLFQAGGYRGWGRQFFAWLSLVGTPLAIVASLLIGEGS